jgi:hypothetical protein
LPEGEYRRGMPRIRTPGGEAEAAALERRIAATPNYQKMEDFLRDAIRGEGGPQRMQEKAIYFRLAVRLCDENTKLPRMSRMEQRFKRGMVLWFSENIEAIGIENLKRTVEMDGPPKAATVTVMVREDSSSIPPPNVIADIFGTNRVGR